MSDGDDMSALRVDPSAALLLGSVSHALSGTDVPVMVLRGAGAGLTGPRHILVAVDGSPASDQARTPGRSCATPPRPSRHGACA